jgi:PIN domain nuclease of toxin-antitoxin system
LVRQIKARTQFDSGGNELEGCRELRFTLIGYSDPADRFLVATARAYDMTLVTADTRFQRLPNPKLLPNV